MDTGRYISGQQLTPPDHRRTSFLPNSMGLDQEMVRPNNDVQNIHHLALRHAKDARSLHRPGKHPQEIRRPARLHIRRPSCLRPRYRESHTMGRREQGFPTRAHVLAEHPGRESRGETRRGDERDERSCSRECGGEAERG